MFLPIKSLNETRKNGPQPGTGAANFCMPKTNVRSEESLFPAAANQIDTAYNPAHPDIQLVVKYIASFEMRALVTAKRGKHVWMSASRDRQ
jgi:hypothetical protein